jgi:fatty acid desaturase
LGDGNTWAIHQLTTTNFAQKNKIVNWYTGGLNHQIEHHIFPNISHIHYGNMQKSLKETAVQLTVRIQNNARCGYRSLQTFERPRNETSNVETPSIKNLLI